VQRNRLKRLLREIMRLQSLRPGWDIVFMARSVAVDTDYHQLARAVIKLLARAQLLESNECLN
jgi:ribonuclease P protein component